MTLPLVVFGCPVANRSWALDRWWKAITVQTQLTNYRWKVVFAYSESEDDTLGKLEQMQGWHDVHIIDTGPSPRPREEMDKHWWPLKRFEYMAGLRNQLLDYAIAQDAEYFFSVDSDIILPPMAFEILSKEMELYKHHGVGAAAPLVNLGAHLGDGTFAYNYMHSLDGGVTSRFNRPATPMPTTPFAVDAIMAAMMIHKKAFDVRWAYHEQGEDLGWSYNALQRGHRMLVVPEIVCNHIMRVPV
jgi:hypothetical protein